MPPTALERRQRAERFAVLRQQARVSLREVGDLTGYSYGAVQNWHTGVSPMPREVAAWLESLGRAVAAIWDAFPPPVRADRRENA